MKIISHFNAITTIAAPWDEVRPLTGASFSATVQFVKERYNFQVTGQSSISQQIGMTTPSFQSGQFNSGDQFVPVNQLEFQPQAIVISCATTDQTTKFYDDLFAFLQKTLEYRIPPKERKRQHITSIIVDFGASLNPLFDKWKNFQSTLNDLVGAGPEITPFGVRFGAVTPDNLPTAERHYVLERRGITPQGENWFFSQAPLDTDAHVKLLSTLESALNG
jgi:hypothetical protein